jgi:WD40 repeat protein
MTHPSFRRLGLAVCALFAVAAALASAAETKPVKKWEATKNKENPYRGIKWHPDGKSLFTYGSESRITRWDVDSEKPVVMYKVSHGGQLSNFGTLSFALSSDGKRLATFDEPVAGQGAMRIFDSDSGKPLASLDSNAFGRRGGGAFALAFSPDDKSLLIGNIAIWIWDMESEAATPLDRRPLEQRSGVHGERQSVLFSKKGDLLIDRSEQIRVWDWKARNIKKYFPAPNSSLQLAALTPDGGTLVMSEEPKCRTLEAWDTATGKVVRKLQPRHKFEIRSVNISPDGGVVISTSGDGTIHLTNLTTGKILRTISPKETEGDVMHADLSPDGKTLATLGEFIRLWEISETAQESPSDKPLDNKGKR